MLETERDRFHEEQVNEDEERRRQFDHEINDCDMDEQQRLREEMERKLKEVDKMMGEEQQNQEMALEAKLNQRRKRRNKLEENYDNVQDQLADNDRNGRDKAGEIEMLSQDKIDKIDEDMDKEEDEGRRKIEQDIAK